MYLLTSYFGGNKVTFVHRKFYSFAGFPWFGTSSHGRAMHSISTSTPLGSCLTATQLRAGLCVNHLAYSSFMLCGVEKFSRSVHI